VYYLGVRGMTTSSYIPLSDIRTFTVYAFLYSIHTFIYNIYLFIRNAIKMYETSIVFGTVHSDGTVIVLQHTLVPDLALHVIVLTLSRIVRSMKRANMRPWHREQYVHLFEVGLLRPFSLQCWLSFVDFFNWFVLDDVQWRFSPILVKRANAVEGVTTKTSWLCRQHSKSTHVTDMSDVTFR